MSSTPAAPNTPQAPSVGDQIGSYINSLPSLVSASNQYSPQIAQQTTQMAQQNAPQMAALQQSLYPQLTNLQNNIAQTASNNISNGMPTAMANQYQNYFRSQAGDNNNSGSGANYVSQQMMAQQQNYANTWANTGNAATGQNPLYNVNGYVSTAPNIAAAYSPTSALSYGAQTYGSYASSYANMYGSNASLQGSMNQMIGSGIGGIAGGVGQAYGSSQIAGAILAT